jgi:hypothetical protein
MPWTYADVQAPESLAFLASARETLKRLRREERGAGG